MEGLSGLTAIAGYQSTINADAQATPEQRLGNSADPRHDIPGEQAIPYPWQSKSTQAASMHGPYGPENQMLGDDWWFFESAGMPYENPMMDQTPSRRAAPWPKGIASGAVPSGDPDDIADQLAQSVVIHEAGRKYNAAIGMQRNLDAQQDQWDELSEVNSGDSGLQPLPRQAMSSGFMWGTRSREHSMARQNEFGFDSKHMHRRYATGPIPGNTMWLKPGGRPLAKSLPGPARPAVGADSPFAGDNLGQAFSPNGAILQTVPPEYTAPPQPYLGNALTQTQQATGDDAVVEWY